MDAVTAFAARYPDLKMHMLIAPNAANILKEKLPAFAATEDQNAQLKRTEEIVSAAGIQWIDATTMLNQHKNEEIILSNNTITGQQKGAYYAFQEAAGALGDFAGGDDSICTAYGHGRVERDTVGYKWL